MSEDENNEVMKEGHLTKLGGNGMAKNWRKRYFVLTKNGVINYFKSISERTEPLGSIPLEYYNEVEIVQREKNFCFKIYNRQDQSIRPFLIHADSQEDMESWISCIHRAIIKLLKDKYRQNRNVKDTRREGVRLNSSDTVRQEEIFSLNSQKKILVELEKRIQDIIKSEDTNATNTTEKIVEELQNLLKEISSQIEMKLEESSPPTSTVFLDVKINKNNTSPNINGNSSVENNDSGEESFTITTRPSTKEFRDKGIYLSSTRMQAQPFELRKTTGGFREDRSSSPKNFSLIKSYNVESNFFFDVPSTRSSITSPKKAIGTLTIRVIEAKDLIVTDSRTSDPYVQIIFGPIPARTTVATKTINPIWPETDVFTFQVDMNTPQDILFEVFDWNMFRAHKRMGTCRLPLFILLDLNQFDHWLRLQPMKKGDVVSGGIHINAQFQSLSGDKESPLFAAIKNCDLKKVQELVTDPRLAINMKDEYGFTPLHSACVLFSENDEEIITCLLNHPCINVNIKNNDENTPLHYFCAKFRNPNCAEPFKAFIKKGAQVNALNKNGETPLHKSIFNNSVRMLMVSLLVENGADVNITNLLGETPLHSAVRLGRDDLITILLKGGADISIKDANKNTPYDIAVELKHEKIISLLKRAMDLIEWLTSIEMGRYQRAFFQEEIYKDNLGNLNMKLLDHMKITTVADKMKLMKAVSSFKVISEGNVSKTPTIIRPSELQTELDQLGWINKTGTWLLQANDLEFTVQLGVGAAGIVYKGLYKGEQVAIKVLKATNSDRELKEFKDEFNIMSTIRSPFVVFFFGACLKPKMCMVMELCSRGSLYHVLKNYDIDFGWDKVLNMSIEMVKGIEALHTHDPQVLHRDLKSLNLMVTEQFHCKVADFGLSRFNTADHAETLTKSRGTPAYCAPEMYDGLVFTEKSDIYSVGIILWEMIYRCINLEYQCPFEEYPACRKPFAILIKVAKNALRPTIPESCPCGLKELVEMSWHQDPQCRPSAKELLSNLDLLITHWESNPHDWDMTIVRSGSANKGVQET